RLAVADAVDLVDDRDLRIARAEEVRVQRVDGPVLHRAAGRDERLARHLAAEDADAHVLRAPAAKEIHLELFQVEDREQLVEHALHAARSRTRRALLHAGMAPVIVAGCGRSSCGRRAWLSTPSPIRCPATARRS